MIPGTHSIDSLKRKRTAVLGTSYTIKKVLQSENGSLSGGVHQWFKRRSTRGEETQNKRWWW
jgi:hypothetical protein